MELNANKIEFYRTIYLILIPIFVIVGTFLLIQLPTSTQDNIICGLIAYLIIGCIIERVSYWINKKKVGGNMKHKLFPYIIPIVRIRLIWKSIDLRRWYYVWIDEKPCDWWAIEFELDDLRNRYGEDIKFKLIPLWKTIIR